MQLAWPPAIVRGARRAHRRLLNPLLAFALPTDCFVCREPLAASQLLGACSGCWAGLRPLEPPLCGGCGIPRPPSTDLLGPARGRCAACLLRRPPTDGVRAVVVYDDVARAILLRAKLGGRPDLFEPLGGLLARAVETLDLAASCTAVVPVPSHPWVTLRRGFSPGRLLAARVARRLGLPLRARLLARRIGGGLSVKRMGARARRRRLTGAFRARGRVGGDRLLLVDDVMTTGATLGDCARALKRAGAREVRAVVWARTLPPPPV